MADMLTSININDPLATTPTKSSRDPKVKAHSAPIKTTLKSSANSFSICLFVIFKTSQ